MADARSESVTAADAASAPMRHPHPVSVRIEALIADPDLVSDVARSASGTDGAATIVSADFDPVPLTNMTTTALGRIAGAMGDGTPWSVVIKLVQSPTCSPLWNEIPSDFHATVMSDLRWRNEPDLYRSRFGEFLPPGLRLPVVYRVDDLDDAHIAVWMEDVAHLPGAWSDADYRGAGTLLGRMWGRLRDGSLPPGIDLPRRDLRGYFFGRILHGVLPPLTSDETWMHPVLADGEDRTLRADIVALADIAPSILDRLDPLPRGATHGDACPQNLLHAAGADEIVAIDWQFGSLNTVGFDVGQVLAGHAESGELDPDRLAGAFDAVLDGHIDGLRAEGVDLDPDVVRTGAVGVLVIRSAFTAIPLENLASAGDGSLIRDRCRYARFLVDLASTIL